jgi:hypothetical protein
MANLGHPYMPNIMDLMHPLILSQYNVYLVAYLHLYYNGFIVPSILAQCNSY